MPKRIQLFLCPHAEKKKETNFYDEAESMDCIDGTVPAVVRLWEYGRFLSTGISASEDSVSSAAVQPGELIETYVPEYAKGFSIEYYEGGAKIIDTHIEATASTAAAAQRILLLPAGATEPLDAQWDGKIEGEVTSVVTLASSHAGHFANLDAVDVVKGCSIKPESCYVNSLKTALENGSAV